jgi:WD40 repeat protein
MTIKHCTVAQLLCPPADKTVALQVSKVDVAALHTCKLHRGWIADAQFLPALNTSEAAAASVTALPWLGTAGNDGALTLWNTAHVHPSGAFRTLASSDSVHSSGIFSMHARSAASGQHIMTASKDASVAYSRVSSSGSIDVVRSWQDVHVGTAKSVRWRNESVAASGGCDRSVALLDVRSPAVARIADAHATVVNQVLWAAQSADDSAPQGLDGCTPAPLSSSFGAADHLLLSNSHSAEMRVWDVRATAQPWAELEGHRWRLRDVTHTAIVQADFTWGVSCRAALCPALLLAALNIV